MLFKLSAMAAFVERVKKRDPAETAGQGLILIVRLEHEKHSNTYLQNTVRDKLTKILFGTIHSFGGSFPPPSESRLLERFIPGTSFIW